LITLSLALAIFPADGPRFDVCQAPGFQYWNTFLRQARCQRLPARLDRINENNRDQWIDEHRSAPKTSPLDGKRRLSHARQL